MLLHDWFKPPDDNPTGNNEYVDVVDRYSVYCIIPRFCSIILFTRATAEFMENVKNLTEV